jgi:ribonuclease T1
MSRRALVVLVVVLVAAVVGTIRTAGDLDEPPASTAEPGVELDTDRRPSKSLDPTSGLPVVDVDQLPPEAADTMTVIRSGGPHPFDRDDTVFQNREGLLPDRPSGYYREYTVVTPGENDRGARRIVAGGNGELYYTADHYSSFVVIARGQDPPS